VARAWRVPCALGVAVGEAELAPHPVRPAKDAADAPGLPSGAVVVASRGAASGARVVRTILSILGYPWRETGVLAERPTVRVGAD
jgi:hypothetical protein